jgi:drug/metabolite transporter (DMT)-like permease
MPFYVYAWIGAIFGGFFVITAKLTSKHAISNPWLFNFLLSLVVLLFTLPAAIYYHAVIPNNWTMIIIAAIFLTLTNIFYIFSNKSLDVSVFMPLYNFKSIFAVLIGIIFFRENIAINKLFFVGVIFVAGILTSLDEKFSLKSFFKVTIAVGLATVFFNTLLNAFTKTAMLSNSVWTATLWTAILNFIFVIPTIPLFKNEIKKLNFSHIIPVGLMGLFDAIGILASNKAYQGNLGISSLIMNTPFSMIFAFLFSVFAPKLLEKHTLKIYAIRFVSTAIMIYAALQLSR